MEGCVSGRRNWQGSSSSIPASEAGNQRVADVSFLSARSSPPSVSFVRPLSSGFASPLLASSPSVSGVESRGYPAEYQEPPDDLRRGLASRRVHEKICP